MLTALAVLTLIASIDWHAIPDAVAEWLDAFDVASEVRDA